jgi:NADH-quinone oxidoreductase subunit H
LMSGFRLHGIGVLWAVLKVLAVVLIITLIRNTNPRIKIKQAVSFFFIWMNIIALAAIALIAFGY